MNYPTLPRLLLSLLLLVSGLTVRAGDEAVIAAVRAADDERTAAIVAADPARLAAIFSDQLHYAHSSGLIDTKASYIDSLVSGRTDYVSFEHLRREFVLAGPGIVLVKGRAIVKAGPAGQPNTNDLNYLAVWREEGGQWRFLAWQSCKNLPPAAPATK